MPRSACFLIGSHLIKGIGNAPKGFYVGPRLYKGAINEIPEGTSAWREVVRGIGIGVETGYQFNFDFGLVLDLGIGLNISDQVIQFAGDPAEDGFSIWPHPNVGVGWKFKLGLVQTANNFRKPCHH